MDLEICFLRSLAGLAFSTGSACCRCFNSRVCHIKTDFENRGKQERPRSRDPFFDLFKLTTTAIILPKIPLGGSGRIVRSYYEKRKIRGNPNRPIWSSVMSRTYVPTPVIEQGAIWWESRRLTSEQTGQPFSSLIFFFFLIFWFSFRRGRIVSAMWSRGFLCERWGNPARLSKPSCRPL